jgi:hypothetical protein
MEKVSVTENRASTLEIACYSFLLKACSLGLPCRVVLLTGPLANPCSPLAALDPTATSTSRCGGANNY